MPKCFLKILKYNSGEKSCSICNLSWFWMFTKKKKESRWNNNLEKSYTEKKARYEPLGWAMLTRCSFDEEENKLDC